MQSSPPRKYQQLQPGDRVTLASLVQRNFGVRELALAMGDPPAPSAESFDAMHSQQATPAPPRVPAPSSGVREAVPPTSFTATACSLMWCATF